MHPKRCCPLENAVHSPGSPPVPHTCAGCPLPCSRVPAWQDGLWVPLSRLRPRIAHLLVPSVWHRLGTEWALNEKERASLVGGGAVTGQAMMQFLRVAPPEHDGEALRPHISLQTAHWDHLTFWRASEEGASHLHFRDEETGVRGGCVTCPSTVLWGYWQNWDLNPGAGIGLH